MIRNCGRLPHVSLQLGETHPLPCTMANRTHVAPCDFMQNHPSLQNQPRWEMYWKNNPTDSILMYVKIITRYPLEKHSIMMFARRLRNWILIRQGESPWLGWYRSYPRKRGSIYIILQHICSRIAIVRFLVQWYTFGHQVMKDGQCPSM